MPILESFPHPSARPQSFVSCGAGTGSRSQKQTVPLLTSLPLPCAGWYLLNCLAGSPGCLPSCCCSVAKLGPTLCNPWTAAPQASLCLTISWSLPKFMSTELVMPSNHFILCRPLLFLPSIFPSIRVFSSESTVRITWPKYWSFSFSLSPCNEYSGLVSFRLDWSDLLAVQGTLKSLLQHHNFSVLCLLYGPTLKSVHDYWKVCFLDYTDFCWQSDIFAF